MLDVVIAYVVVVLVLSTLTTALLQLVQRLLPLRSWWLRRCLQQLHVQVVGKPVDGSTVDELLRTGAVNPLARRWPDRIEGPQARQWLRERYEQLEGKPEPSDDDEDEHADPESSEDHLPKFLRDAGFDSWWTHVEKQMSSAFRMVVIPLSILFGLVLSVAMGLDAISVATHLSQSPAEVEALAQDANRDVGNSRRLLDDEALVRMIDAELRADGSDAKARARRLVCLGEAVNNLQGAAAVLRVAELELRLSDDEPLGDCEPADVKALGSAVTATRATIDEGLGFGGYPLSDNPITRWLGYLLMALFVGLGAPFWFEILSLLRLPIGSPPPANNNRN